MEEAKEAIKKVAKMILKRGKKILLILILPIIPIIIILAGITYFLTIDDGTYKEDDWSSVPFASEQFINSLSINKEGNLENSFDAEELWDKMLENKSRVDEYLDTPEELARLIRAEVVTKFPDTRPNPNEPIDWEEMIKKQDLFQGIIKFKRADTEGNQSNLIYTDPETFQSYIDQYNNNGDEKAKQAALSHFTLKKSATSTTQKKLEEDTNKKEEDTKEDENKEKNKDKKKKDEEDKKQTATVTPVNGDGYTEEYTSSAGITYKHYKQFAGSYKDDSYWSGTIHSSGCGPTSIAILASGLKNTELTPKEIAAQMNSNYGFTSYDTLKQEMDSLGMTSEVIQAPSAETIQENLRNGKVMLVSVDSRTKFTKNSHIMAIVDINENGQVYVCNPGSGNSDKFGWQDISNITIGCKYIVTTEAGATGIASTSSNNSSYIAVVATWSQINTTSHTTDSDANLEGDEGSQYSITTTNINYESMVEPYTMPFDLLWAFLVVGEDKDFVFELADLVYGSEIEITIHDNLTTHTTIDESHYTKRTKAIVDATITAECDDNKSTGTVSNDEHDPCQDDEEYVTTKTTQTQTNTLDISITKANVWIVDYENKYTYSQPTETTSTSRADQPDEENYPSSPTSVGDNYSCEEIDKKKEELRKKVTTDTNQNVTFTENINVKYYTRKMNQYNIITNKINTQKWIKGNPTSIEKTDEATKPNFVTIFKDTKYLDNKRKIKDVPTWLFEIIETNDSTKDLLDTVKYLLYKAAGIKSGVKEFDKNRFLPGELTSLNPNICGGDVEEKVWYTLRNLGYSEYAVAGVMGNIYGESGFDPAAIEKKTGEGHGLCQWSFGRKDCLFSYAQSKGKDWSDVDIQIEFLIAEITLPRQGDAVPYTEHQFFAKYAHYREEWTNATNVEDATRAFCLGFERCSETDYIESSQKRIDAAQGYYNQYKGKTWEGSNSAVVKEARGALGVPYVWGGESYTEGMDCSGLVKVCYQRALGVDLPHKAESLMTDDHFTTVNSIDELQAGGIIVTKTHVGIYSGEKTVIHEPQTGDVCKEVPVEDFIRSRPTAIFRNYSGQ
ncbi:MAG: hypothetical protein HFJ34_02250 [Clostridia bacterium]|nr:hypothetical protein [Clostridia bacterium]